MMKNLILIVLASLSISLNCNGQEHESIMSAPEYWQAEIIPFPLGFAREIEFEGFEELRFAPGWSDSTHQNFWTYSFVWYIEKTSPMTEDELTANFNLYYDELMGTNENKADSTNLNRLDKTISQFVKTNDGFSGEMRVYDRFFTKEYITLNIIVKESFCDKSNKQIVLCDITPQPFDHEVWSIFDEVKLTVECD